jgi:hypothetical protein
LAASEHGRQDRQRAIEIKGILPMSTDNGSGKTYAAGKPGRARAVPVAELAGKVLAPTVARRAGMTIDLIAAWPDIVGPPHGDYTQPEKIVWPRKASDDDPFQPGKLVVACDGARAVLFQHELGQCLERVNTFFGFDAIARIQIVQKPVRARPPARRAGPPELDAKDSARLAEIVDGIEDEGLRQRLEKLGRGVFGSRRGR